MKRNRSSSVITLEDYQKLNSRDELKLAGIPVSYMAMASTCSPRSFSVQSDLGPCLDRKEGALFKKAQKP